MALICIRSADVGLNEIQLVFDGETYSVMVDDPRPSVHTADWASAQLWFEHVCNVVESEYSTYLANKQEKQAVKQQEDPFADIPEAQLPKFETMPDFEW